MVSFLINSEEILLTNSTYRLDENKFKDVFYHYIFPLVSFIGCVQNILCAIVLSQKELRSAGAFFQYSLVNSINSALVTFLLFFMFLTNCGHICETSYSYISQLYNIIAILFIVSSLYCFSSLIQIAISFNLYFILLQKCKRLNTVSPSLVMIISFLFSNIYGILFAISFRITPSTMITINKYNQKYVETTYHIHLNFHNKVLSFASMFIVIILNNVFLIILIVVNVLILYESRKLMERKKYLGKNSFMTIMALTNPSVTVTRNNSNLGNELKVKPCTVHPLQCSIEKEIKRRQRQNKKALRKILIMFLWISLIFCSSRFLFSIFCLALLFYPDTVFYSIMDFSNYFWASIVYSSYFYVYFKTNKTFRAIFIRKFLRRIKQ